MVGAKLKPMSMGRRKLQKIDVPSGTIVAPTTPKKAYPEDDDYVIFLVNTSNLTITRGCYNFNPNGNNNWFVLPTTGHNCNSDCDTCGQNQEWTPILNVNCAENIDLTIATNPDASGEVYGATFNVTPSCQYSGGFICIT
jgi:hypothetical protein